MKYKVIGWTFYENQNFKNEPLTFAARHAIVDEIKTKGYLFSGYEHQEALYGCPVLNDGKKRMCSQRGFAGIMAEAHGEIDLYSYSRYMFGIKKEAIIAPKMGVDMQAFSKKTDLCEKFSLDVSREDYERALSEGVLVLGDLPNLRYIDACDTITVINNFNKTIFEVLGIDRYKDLTDEERLEISMPNFGIKEMQIQERKMHEAKTLLKIKLKLIKNNSNGG